MYVAKTKALISLAVTAKLICIFVFAYAKKRFSHDTAQIIYNQDTRPCLFHLFPLTILFVPELALVVSN